MGRVMEDDGACGVAAGWPRGASPRAEAVGEVQASAPPRQPRLEGPAHDLEQRTDRLAALADGLSPIGFLDVHGLIEREGVAWPPYNLHI